MREYQHPFELHVVIGIDPKVGRETVELGDRVFIVDRDGNRQNYDPRDVIQRVNDLLRDITRSDDGVAWLVRSVKLQEDPRC